MRGHAKTNETGGDDEVGCVGQAISLYPCIPLNAIHYISRYIRHINPIKPFRV